jgi:hypothetical protein
MTAKPTDGGDAFPHEGFGSFGVAAPGISLRDWFAGQALIGLTQLAAQDEHFMRGEYGPQVAYGVAKACYVMADAMLRERDGH